MFGVGSWARTPSVEQAEEQCCLTPSMSKLAVFSRWLPTPFAVRRTSGPLHSRPHHGKRKTMCIFPLKPCRPNERHLRELFKPPACACVYPPREPSSDKRVRAVSPRGRGATQQLDPGGNGDSMGSNRDEGPEKACVTPLVQGHYGSVMALAVFEGVSEFVTAGYDRSVRPAKSSRGAWGRDKSSASNVQAIRR